MTTTTKDLMIKFKTTIRGKNSKGGDRTQLYLTQEEAASLASTLASYANNEAGVKLDIHTSKRETAEGRTFDSSIAFIKPTASKGAEGGVVAGAKKVFVPRTAKKELA